MNYEIKITEHKRPLPYVVFEDEKYDLLGEFLLAERSILKEIAALLESKESGTLSGNAFTLTVEGKDAVITNDITDKTLSVPTEELRQLTEDYRAEVRRLRKRT